MRTGLTILATMLLFSACKEKYTAEQYLLRGIEMQKEKRFEQATKDFTKAIRLKPDLEEAYRRRATIYLGQAFASGAPQASLQAAVADFTKAIELRPYNPAALHFRGEAHVHAKRTVLGLADLDAACKMRNKYSCTAARRVRAGPK